MRMPWDFLRSRKSKNTPRENDVEKLPASSVISLKIRVADSADLPPLNPSLVDTANSVKLLTELDAAPEPTDVPVSDDGKAEAQVVEEGLVSPKPDAKELSVAGKDEAQALTNGVTAPKSAYADFNEDRHTDKLAVAAEPVQAEEVPPPREVSLQSTGLNQRPDVQPPIIDLPSTRRRDARGGMAKLDLEITELRRALSSKLTVQNEQLRQLLQRFPD